MRQSFKFAGACLSASLLAACAGSSNGLSSSTPMLAVPQISGGPRVVPQNISIAAYACYPYNSGYFAICDVLNSQGGIIGSYTILSNLPSPPGIVTDPSGHIFAVLNFLQYSPCCKEQIAQVFNPAFLGVITTANVTGNYYALFSTIAFSSHTNQLAVGGLKGNTAAIWVFPYSSIMYSPSHILTAGSGITALAFDYHSGDCFAAETEYKGYTGGWIFKFHHCNSAGSFTGFFSYYSAITGIAFDGANNLYFTNGSSLYKCTTKTCQQLFSFSPLVGNIAFDRYSRNLFFIHNSTSESDVYVYSVKTGKYRLFAKGCKCADEWTNVASSNGPDY